MIITVIDEDGRQRYSSASIALMIIIVVMVMMMLMMMVRMLMLVPSACAFVLLASVQRASIALYSRSLIVGSKLSSITADKYLHCWLRFLTQRRFCNRLSQRRCILRQRLSISGEASSSSDRCRQHGVQGPNVPSCHRVLQEYTVFPVAEIRSSSLLGRLRAQQ